MANPNPKRWASSTPFLVLVALLFLGIGFGVFHLGMRRFGEQAERVRRDSIKEKISMVHHALEPLLGELRAGRMNQAEAIERARALVRTIRYEDDTGSNYVFMNGMDGTVLVRPQRPQDEGTKNFAVQVDRGKIGLSWEIIPQLRAKPEGLFVSYPWLNPATGRIDEKVSFILVVPELDVMIGTGAHTKEASRAQVQLLRKGVWIFAGLMVLLAGPFILMLRAARQQNLRLEAEMRERLEAEAALRENEAKIRGILDFSFGFTGLLTPEGFLLEANQTALQFIGAAHNELVGRPFWECPWWAHSQEVQGQLRSAIETAAGGRLVRYETTMRSAEGELHRVDFSLKPVLAADGRVIQLIPEARDITELKRAQAALAEQEQRLRLMLEATGAGLWDLDLERRVWTFSDPWAEMLGYRPEELARTSETWPSLLHPEDRTEAEAKVQACLSAESPTYDCEYRLRHKEGHWVWIHARGAVVARDPEGRPIRFMGSQVDISPRKEAEQALRAAKARAEQYLETAQVILVAMDDQARTTLLNRKGHEVLGYDVGELEGKDWFRTCLPPEEYEAVFKVYGEIMAGRVEPFAFYENQVLTKGGDRKLIAWHNTLLQDEQGRILGTLSSGEDITERRQAEESLRKLSAAVEQSPLSIMITDSAGVIEYVNPHFTETTGYESSEVVGRKPNFLKSGFHPQELYREMWDTILAEGTWRGELCNRKKNGELFWEQSFIAPIQNGEGRITHLMSIKEDITERRRVRKEMEDLKVYLSNLIDSMPSILVGLDREGRVTQWNREAALVTGILPGEALGSSLEVVLPDFFPLIEPVRQEVMQFGEPEAMERLLVEKEGERSFFDVVIFPLVSGAVEGVVLRIEDVTERERIHGLMVQTEKMLSVGGLAAGMAHEINNPLGIISQAAQNIERRLSPELPANQAAAGALGLDLVIQKRYFQERNVFDFVASIQEAVGRASRIVGNMLQFSRQPDSIKLPASLPNLIQQALELAANDYDLKKNFDFRNIEVVQEIEPELPLIPMVSVEVEQVIFNLLKNAAQALGGNPPDRPPRIEIRLWREERHVVLELEDNGTGMEESVRRRVFEPFFTTKPPGLGTGLGLSVAFMIITQNHKGLLEVESEPGLGACFRIRLPLQEGEDHG